MQSKIFSKDCSLYYSDTTGKNINKGRLPEIAFLGRSNVGKSTLINTLLARKSLVRTSKKPGSTIKINYFNLSSTLMIVDLPGLGYAKQSQKTANQISSMLSNYFHNNQNLKLLVYIIDIRRGLKQVDMNILQDMLAKNIQLLLVLNKSDKLNQNEISETDNLLKKEIQHYNNIKNAVTVSCLQKKGIDDIRNSIVLSLSEHEKHN